jgi:hypothetical protein
MAELIPKKKTQPKLKQFQFFIHFQIFQISVEKKKRNFFK